jgi:hypothetical protein
MSHVYHDALEGFDARQILHDGCGECEHRGKDLREALAHLDSNNFHRAWRRAFDLWASHGDHNAVGPVSHAEQDLLTALWGIQVHLQREGYTLDGDLPVPV